MAPGAGNLQGVKLRDFGKLFSAARAREEIKGTSLQVCCPNLEVQKYDSEMMASNHGLK